MMPIYKNYRKNTIKDYLILFFLSKIGNYITIFQRNRPFLGTLWPDRRYTSEAATEFQYGPIKSRVSHTTSGEFLELSRCVRKFVTFSLKKCCYGMMCSCILHCFRPVYKHLDFVKHVLFNTNLYNVRYIIKTRFWNMFVSACSVSAHGVFNFIEKFLLIISWRKCPQFCVQ